MTNVPLHRALFTLVLLAVAASAALAQQQIGTWTLEAWTDPATGASHPAIWSGTDYGLDGRVIFACDDTAPTGITVILAAQDLAADNGGDVMVGAKFGLDPEVGPWTGWIRGEDGSYVRSAGDPATVELILTEMASTVSPVFMLAFGPIEAGFHMFVLESAGFSDALGALPCGP